MNKLINIVLQLLVVIKWLWVDIGNSVEFMKVLPSFFNLIYPVSFFAFVCKNCFLDIFSVRNRFCDFSNVSIFSTRGDLDGSGYFGALHGLDDFNNESMNSLLVARSFMAWRR